MTHNQINYWNYRESSRHNVEAERETNRHNVRTEDETERHNRVGEVETERHNRATEGIDLGRLNESIRHNKVSESQGWSQIAETSRHNRATESLTDYANREQSRHNLAGEQETYRHNVQSEQYGLTDLNIRSDIAYETSRHNRNTESIDAFRAQSQAALNEANKELTQVKTTWESLLQSENVKMTEANRKYVQQQIKNLDVQKQKLQQEIDILNQDEFYRLYDEFLKGVGTASKAVDAFVPG